MYVRFKYLIWRIVQNYKKSLIWSCKVIKRGFLHKKHIFPGIKERQNKNLSHSCCEAHLEFSHHWCPQVLIYLISTRRCRYMLSIIQYLRCMSYIIQHLITKKKKNISKVTIVKKWLKGKYFFRRTYLFMARKAFW